MKKIIYFLMIVLSVLILSSLAEGATVSHSKPKQVIIVIDKLSLDDITVEKMPNLYSLQKIGAIGLMNTNSLNGRESQNTFLSIANGQGSSGNINIGKFYDVKENPLEEGNKVLTAGELYTSLTGWESGNYKLVNPWILSTIKDKQIIKNNIQVGKLGVYLAKEKISNVIIGNSDTSEPRRYAASLIMDKYGRVQEGIVDKTTTLVDKSYPFGVRTNYEKVLDYTKEFIPKKDLIVIELGDLSRLDEYSAILTDNQYSKIRLNTAKNLDIFIQKLIPLLNLEKDRLMVLAPTPSLKEQANNNTVTPLYMIGKGINSGILYSSTTRRNGLISNIDVAPTLLNFYDNKSFDSNFDGRVVASKTEKDTLSLLREFNNKLVLNYNQRPPILITTAIVEIVLIIASLLVVRFNDNPKVIKWQRQASMGFLLVPLTLLIFKLYKVGNTLISGIILLVIVISLLKLVENKRINTEIKFAIIGIITSITILIDILTGYRLMIYSPLGYDLMVGARYYGLGNEFSGILMGATILGVASLSQFLDAKGYLRIKGIPLIAVLAIVTGIIYAPFLGADAGGVITAIASFGYLILSLNNVNINSKVIIGISLIIFTALFGGAALDHIFNTSSQSHIGKAMGQLMQGNFQIIGDIIIRKVSMNWKLIQFSIWSKVLLAVIVGLTFFTFYPKGVLKQIELENQQIFKGLKAVIVASIVGFIVNDSGLVQAATTAIYVIFPLIYLVYLKKENTIIKEKS